MSRVDFASVIIASVNTTNKAGMAKRLKTWKQTGHDDMQNLAKIMGTL